MPPKYIIADEEEPELNIQKKITLLEKQIDKCDKHAMTTAVSLQGDLSYYLYEKHIPQERYFEYKSQLTSIVKKYMKGCSCRK